MAFTPVEATTKDGHHTTFIFIVTKAKTWLHKGEVQIFGEDNFHLLAEDEKQKVLRNCRRQGFNLILKGTAE